MSSAGSLWGRLQALMEAPRTTAESHEAAVRLASAVLLVELARADAVLGSEERATLERVLAGRFGLGSSEAVDLVAGAERSADQSISLHDHVTDINRGLDYAEKRAVLKMLWQVAYADGVLHHHEEHLLRRLADLLHLPHEDFIRLKLEVLEG